jgi:redox-sensitive bicupin YhaK (pirin superfamily)
MSVELVIDARPRDLGGFSVRRVLPAVQRRLVGPFIFFDHMGPAHLPLGTGMDVRPHPHIALATLTYLFEGEIDHRDSLGTFQRIHPGDVNWMIAGRGITHSERSSPESRKAGVRIHGVQSWLALPLEEEEREPSFEHRPSSTIPKIRLDGAVLDVIAGTAYGERSPTSVLSPTLYVHVKLDAGARVPIPDDHEERAVYVVEGSVTCAGTAMREGTMAVLEPGARLDLETEEASRVLIVGGAKLEGSRHIYWNFISSSKERIERAKDDWRNDRFPRVVGDEVERIPLPDL